jgi:Pyridine nucleotide-disulphide oxidoreductase, dimerisation domain
MASELEKGETQGFMKVVVDAETKGSLGAAILGVTGDEVIHTLLDVMYAKAPYTTVSRAMHIHPLCPSYCRPCFKDCSRLYKANKSSRRFSFVGLSLPCLPAELRICLRGGKDV